MARVFYTGAYKPPREFNWVVGVVLLFLTLGLSFTGYLLPWDQLAIWAVTVGTSLAGYSPFIAKQANFLLLGGVVVGPEHAVAVVRAPRVGVAVRVGDLPGGPFLADPQGRRHLGTAVGGDGARWREKDTPLDQAAFDATLADELAKGADRRVAEGRARLGGGPRLQQRNPEEEAAPAAAAAAAAARRRGGGAPAAAPAGCRRPLPAPAAAAAARPRRRPGDHSPRARGPAADRQHPDTEEGHGRQAPAARARPARGHPAGRARAGRPRATSGRTC